MIKTFYISGLIVSLVLFVFLFVHADFFIANSTRFLASVFFQQSVYTEDVVEKHKDPLQKIKVLIVPGHDTESYGAFANGTTEAELNLRVASELESFLKKEEGIETFLTRNRFGYNPILLKYLGEEKENIQSFYVSKKEIMNSLIEEGKVESKVLVHHNFARPEVVELLYGVNKFANDNGFDITIHIHFNDYAGRTGSSGEYSGFSIYIPEKQYSNNAASYEFAQKVARHLSVAFAPSNLPKETMITEDQELIAVGANNTVDSVVSLIEYGYIYESQFTDYRVQDVILKELAYQTYLGVLDYVENTYTPEDTFIDFKEYAWGRDLSFGDKGEDVLALQDFLHDRGYYPQGDTLNNCPLNGNFGKCTESALTQYQKDNNILPTGYFGEVTKGFVRQ